ncbi:MAG: hypothetical protein LAO21_17980 [Acidobacteriia bacterium]|nr:hypothetical protein [Terriglobia bacterium]
MNIGIVDLFAVLLMVFILPAVIWALVILHRIRAGQLAVQMKLDLIERLLQRP